MNQWPIRPAAPLIGQLRHAIAPHVKHSLFVLSALLICFISPVGNLNAFAQPSVSSETLAVRLLTLIKEKNFSKASLMFHYPQGQSASEREADRAGVADWLRRLSSELGGLESFKTEPVGQAEEVVSISVAGGDVAYWSSRGALDTRTHKFKAAFQKEPDTRLVIRVMNTGGKWEIQSFHFGVPTTRPNARAFMTDLARKLIPKT